MKLRVVPITLAVANAHVARFHRHHKPTMGHRFSLACYDGPRLCGVAIIGRPVARNVNQETVAEVTRLCTDGTRNACSILYAAAARACEAMGFEWIQTYTLASEPGASLRASGWTDAGEAGGGQWKRPAIDETRLWPMNRTDQPTEMKRKWIRKLNAPLTQDPHP